MFILSGMKTLKCLIISTSTKVFRILMCNSFFLKLWILNEISSFSWHKSFSYIFALALNVPSVVIVDFNSFSIFPKLTGNATQPHRMNIIQIIMSILVLSTPISCPTFSCLIFLWFDMQNEEFFSEIPFLSISFRFSMQNVNFLPMSSNFQLN